MTVVGSSPGDGLTAFASVPFKACEEGLLFPLDSEAVDSDVLDLVSGALLPVGVCNESMLGLGVADGAVLVLRLAAA